MHSEEESQNLQRKHGLLEFRKIFLDSRNANGYTGFIVGGKFSKKQKESKIVKYSIVLVIGLITLGCGEAETQNIAMDGCTPGSTQQCFGDGACSGAQVCEDDGFSWSDCSCGTETGGSGTGGDEATGGEATGGLGQTGGEALTGGDTPTGGALTGGVGTGGESTGGGGACVPRTCETFAIDWAKENWEGWDPSTHRYPPTACGIIEDGCGNYVNCGNECGVGECGVQVVTGVDEEKVIPRFNPDNGEPITPYLVSGVETTRSDIIVDNICGWGFFDFGNAVALCPDDLAQLSDTYAIVIGQDSTPIPEGCTVFSSIACCEL